jgi:small-conductance mechanosensitive channel/CRP-like cAMP-binding protein
LPQLLLGNVSLIVGLVLAVAVFAMRRLARDAQLREDLKAAFTSYIGFLIFKLALLPFEPGTPPHPLYQAAVVLWMLSFAFGLVRMVVSLSLWGYRRLTRKPTSKIFRDVLHIVLYLTAAIPILKSQLAIDLTSILATSAILSVVLGLALQDTLGNLFAGLSLQSERPFEVGDFIQVGPHTGRVQQTGWRSTRIETLRNEQITITNNTIAREAVKNFTRGGQPIGFDVFFSAGYGAPPNEVRRQVLATFAEVPLILKSPAPSCRAASWDDNGVKYMARCFIADYSDSPNLHDELYTRLWYRFSRAGIEIPFPQRVIHTRAPPPESTPAWWALLEEVEVLKPFTAPEREALARSAKECRFGQGEKVVTEGDEGHTFYLVVRGKLIVTTRAAGELGRLSTGDHFGEMSLLTGAPRNATVTALEDALLFEFDRAEFKTHFAAKPQLAARFSALLARHKEAIESASANAVTEIGTDRAEGQFLGRLKQIFALRD